MTTQNAKFLTFALSFCTFIFTLYILKRFVVRNQTPSFHHVYKPRWNYQAKLKLLARIEVLDSPLPQVDHYLMPGLKFSGNSRQIYSRAAKVPEVPKEYPVD